MSVREANQSVVFDAVGLAPAMALTQIPYVDDMRAECIDNCFEAVQACEW
jgi:hypothetical protein